MKYKFVYQILEIHKLNADLALKIMIMSKLVYIRKMQIIAKDEISEIIIMVLSIKATISKKKPNVSIRKISVLQ